MWRHLNRPLGELYRDPISGGWTADVALQKTLAQAAPLRAWQLALEGAVALGDQSPDAGPLEALTPQSEKEARLALVGRRALC